MHTENANIEDVQESPTITIDDFAFEEGTRFFPRLKEAQMKQSVTLAEWWKPFSEMAPAEAVEWAEKTCLDDYPELAYGYTLEPYLNDTWDGLFPPTPGDIIAMAAYKYGVCKGFRDLKAEIERGMRETNGALS